MTPLFGVTIVRLLYLRSQMALGTISRGADLPGDLGFASEAGSMGLGRVTNTKQRLEDWWGKLEGRIKYMNAIKFNRRKT